jgi:hypothetical protein
MTSFSVKYSLEQEEVFKEIVPLILEFCSKKQVH